MRIGILTIHSAHNYGAVLQAFALNRYLCEINKDTENTVELIDYRPSSLNSIPKIRFGKDIVSNLIEFERFLMLRKIKNSCKMFDEFIKNSDSLSELCTNHDDLNKIAPNYDLIISGSDQIWNFTTTCNDRAFYLNFENYGGKKISYSSSFGAYKFNENEKAEIKEYLSDYKALSCREKDGCDFVSGLTSEECQNVCDPTLLLIADDYLSLLKTNKIRKKISKLIAEDYILIYNIASDDRLFEFVKKLNADNKLKVYHICPTIRKKPGVKKVISDASPQEFIALFSNAKYIVTNSFHGTCFSLIFKKDFWTVSSTGKNRIYSLLNRIDLLDRLIGSEGSTVDSMNIEKTDYIKASEKLENFINQSKEYLNSALSD